ncbi:MAG: 16S rRNA (guanine(527)-N(7))-methyltransferase RsmG [Rhodanobacteraceae bacterium]
MFERVSLRPQLEGGLADLDIDLPGAAIESLLDYVGLLQQWNAAYNLTSVRDARGIISRHLLDSLAIARYVVGETLADLGSGAGLPGIPLAVAAPRRRFTLVDSNGKKTRFLREVVRKLGLRNVEVAECRVEQVDGRFDCVTARAFASLADMLKLGGRLLADDGTWLAQKGRLPRDELAAVPGAFRVTAIHRVDVPGLDAERHLVIIRRNAAPGNRQPP